MQKRYFLGEHFTSECCCSYWDKINFVEKGNAKKFIEQLQGNSEREREIPAIDKSKNATRFLHFALNDLKAAGGKVKFKL